MWLIIMKNKIHIRVLTLLFRFEVFFPSLLFLLGGKNGMSDIFSTVKLGNPRGLWASCHPNTRFNKQSFWIYFRLWLSERCIWGGFFHPFVGFYQCYLHLPVLKITIWGKRTQWFWAHRQYEMIVLFKDGLYLMSLNGMGRWWKMVTSPQLLSSSHDM